MVAGPSWAGARRRPLVLRRLPPGSTAPVGRVGEHNVEGLRLQPSVQFAQVRLDDLDPATHVVELNAAPGAIGQGRLHFDTDNAPGLRSGSQQQRNDPRPRAQVRHCLA